MNGEPSIAAQTELRSLRMARRDRAPAFTDLASGRTMSFADVEWFGETYGRALRRRGLGHGDVVRVEIKAAAALAPVLLACWSVGVDVDLVPGPSGRKTPALIVSAEPIDTSSMSLEALASLGDAEAAFGHEAGMAPGTPLLTANVATEGASSTWDDLLRSARQWSTHCAVRPDDRLLSASAPRGARGLITSVIAPLLFGIPVLRAEGLPIAGSGPFWAAAAEATLCDLPAPLLGALAERGGTLPLPASIRTVFCGDDWLAPSVRAAAERVLGRPIHIGFGTASSGFWAAAGPVANAGPALYGLDPAISFGIRPFRSPLHLVTAPPDAPSGEITWTGSAAPDIVHRTGSVGYMTENGAIVVAGPLAAVAVRHGQTILPPDIDALLTRHPEVEASISFRETGASLSEPIVTACRTTLREDQVRSLVAGADPAVVPDRVMLLPHRAGRPTLPPLPILRAAATGSAGRDVLTAVTARRFRRNPAYDEAGLRAMVDAALLAEAPLRFLMFWGCGPRRQAAAPDHAAIAALADLLAAVETAAPLSARAHIICTDVHATNNGHSEAHYTSYFAQIREAAAGLNAEFELESEVWHRGGLSKARISASEHEPAFERKWAEFPLKDRFVQQASRHSRMQDKLAAARHYYATCLLERDVLKRLFAGSVFLTYNGPEFNECFPDLPTLYVYPGPRGRNDKPWFVTLDDADPMRVVAA